jgi:hypothetical protein
MRLAVAIQIGALGACALIDAASGPAADGDADGDTDTDSGTGTDTGTGSETDTGTGTDTGTDTGTGTGTENLQDCFEPDRSDAFCEDQGDHAAECAERDSDFDDPKVSPCDPIDQCDCVAPQACYQTSSPVAPSSETACFDPGTEAEGAVCTDHTDCGEGLFCLAASLSETGNNSCELPCDDACDCPGDEVCLPFTPPFCRLPTLCDPAADDPCPGAGEGCVAFVDISRGTYATTCLRGPFDVAEGEACVSMNECEIGTQCISSFCKRACHETADCPDGQTCQRVENVTGCEFEIRVCD